MKPDVVTLDFSMPGMNGLEAAKIILSSYPRPSIIMFTAHQSKILEETACAVGVKKVVSKTEGLEPLLSEIQKLAAASRPPAALRAHPGI